MNRGRTAASPLASAPRWRNHSPNIRGYSVEIGPIVWPKPRFAHKTRTPRILGYLFQHPKSHSLHHETGVHQHNYSDLALWDILFGTFRNPDDFQTRGYGFAGDAWREWGTMLRFVDVEGTEAAVSSVKDRVSAEPEVRPSSG